MKFKMYYKDIPVMRMDMLISPYTMKVISFEVINTALLPFSLKNINRMDNEDSLVVMDIWLKNRAIPDYRSNIDDFVKSIHQLYNTSLGRMYGYQHMSALLSYYCSGFDYYYVTPEKTEYIYNGRYDDRFISLYKLLQLDNDRYNEIRNNPDELLNEYLIKRMDKAPQYNGCFKTMSFTIPSEVPSWWEKRENKIALHQIIRPDCQHDHAKEANFLINNNEMFYGKRYIEGNELITTFSLKNDENIIFLSDLLIDTNCQTNLDVQLKQRLNAFYNTEEEIKKINLMKGFSTSEIGVVINNSNRNINLFAMI